MAALFAAGTNSSAQITLSRTPAFKNTPPSQSVAEPNANKSVTSASLNALAADTLTADTLTADTLTANTVIVDTLLPDAPQPAFGVPGFADSSSVAVDADSTTKIGPAVQRTRLAPTYHRYIEPDQIPQTLTRRQRLLFGFHQPLSPFFLLTITAAAGYEQASNGSPNYGTDLGAYGQRVGAAAIRNLSQSVFEDSLMAPLLHEDPRYYVMGDRRNPIIRGVHAIAGVLFTKTDTGDTEPNYALFSGYAGAAALTNAYYPASNHGFEETAKSFGGSLGGAALSNLFREFLPDALHAAHLEKTQ